MKKIILLHFIIFSLRIWGQEYNATIYFEDGTSKKGTANIIKSGLKKINFKENRSSKIETIETESLKKIEYYDAKTNDTAIFERRDIIGGYKKNGKIPKINKLWIQKLTQVGDITMYARLPSSAQGHYNMGTGNIFTPTTVNAWFFQYKDNLPTLIFFLIDGSPMGVKNQNLWIALYFNELCPNLVKDHREKKIKLSDTPVPLLEYYEKNCTQNNK